MSKQNLSIIFFLIFLLFTTNSSLAASKKPTASPPIIKNKVFYFYNINPTIPQPLKPNKKQVEQYYTPLIKAIKARNPEADAKQSFIKGQKIALGTLGGKRGHEMMMAWAGNKIGFFPTTDYVVSVVFVEGDTCINNVCLLVPDYCQSISACYDYSIAAYNYRARFNAALYRLYKTKKP